MRMSLKVCVNVVAAGIISSIPAAKVLQGPNVMHIHFRR